VKRFRKERRNSMRMGRFATMVAIVSALVLGTAVYGADKKGATTPPKKEAPKKETTVERQIPSWNEIEGKEVTEKDKGKAKGQVTVFDEFPGTAACKDKKPFAVYFFWPDTTDKADAKKIKDCAAFEKALAAATDVKKELSKEFGTFKCDVKKLGKELQKKYAKTPCLLVFDATGKQQISETTFPAKEKTLADKLAQLKKTSDKSEAKKDKEQPKEQPKETPKKK
jgi:hypothetical protein